jgi:hypothetical protein
MHTTAQGLRQLVLEDAALRRRNVDAGPCLLRNVIEWIGECMVKEDTTSVPKRVRNSASEQQLCHCRQDNVCLLVRNVAGLRAALARGEPSIHLERLYGPK